MRAEEERVLRGEQQGALLVRAGELALVAQAHRRPRTLAHAAEHTGGARRLQPRRSRHHVLHKPADQASSILMTMTPCACAIYIL